jgi:hypothetical protein
LVIGKVAGPGYGKQNRLRPIIDRQQLSRLQRLSLACQQAKIAPQSPWFKRIGAPPTERRDELGPTARYTRPTGAQLIEKWRICSGAIDTIFVMSAWDFEARTSRATMVLLAPVGTLAYR